MTDKLKSFRVIRGKKVIFPDVGEVDMRNLTDDQALRIFLAGHINFVKLTKNADKDLFKNVPEEKLKKLKTKLDKRQLNLLNKILD